MSWETPVARLVSAAAKGKAVGPRAGQLADDDERFCPFAAVAKYPYRYMYQNEVNSKKVAERFFDGGQFRGRGWSIYYIRTLLDTNSQPLLLIPKTEVQAFFQYIKENTGIYLPFPDVARTPGFDLGFREEGSPRPRFLGHLTSNFSLLDLQDMIPAEGIDPEESLELDDRSFPAFRRKMEAAILASKNSNKANKDRKKRERVVQKGRWRDQLKRAQCYFGLRHKVTAKLEDFDRNPNATWEESEEARKAYEIAAGINLPPLDVKKAAPYPFNLNVVFVCVDIEVYERDSKKLTEIGISTLDTLDIIKTAPGEGGTEWMSHMRCRHFRTVEHAHLVNRDFVSGCPEKFEPSFGVSEWISVKEIPQVVAACFKEPYSAPGQYTPHPADLNDVPRHGSNIQPLVDPKDGPKRNVILVGHDIRSDISYLRTIGYDVTNLGNLVEAVDTTDLWRAWKHEQNPTKLGNVLLELELVGWHLHNAGNDAAYTMQSLIGICVATRNPATKPLNSVSDAQLDEAAMEAKARVQEDKEEWAVVDEEGGDGGSAVSIRQAEIDQSVSRGRRADERELQRLWNQSSSIKGGKKMGLASQPQIISGKKYGWDGATQQTATTAAHPSTYVPPHLRDMSEPVESESKTPHLDGGKDVKPKVALPPLSKQMERRLVIFDDEEYGV